MFFFFKQKTAYEMRISDWSSDVCSSDLTAIAATGAATGAQVAEDAGAVGAEQLDAAAIAVAGRARVQPAGRGDRHDVVGIDPDRAAAGDAACIQVCRVVDRRRGYRWWHECDHHFGLVDPHVVARSEEH